MLVYARLCSFMLVYARLCSFMLVYARKSVMISMMNPEDFG